MLKLEYMGWEAQKRHRMSFNRAYDPSSGEKKQVARIILDQANGQNYDLSGPLGCLSIFYKKYPKAMSKKKRAENPWWDTKPDSDNLEKFLFDVLEKQASIIENDSRICAKLCFKLWGEYDATVVLLDRWGEGSFFFQRNDMVGFNDWGYCFSLRSFVKLPNKDYENQV